MKHASPEKYLLKNRALNDDPHYSILIEIMIPFYDTDAMGIVWHGNYYRYLEVAREALMKQIGYSYRQMKQSGYIWPIVDARLKYIKSLSFDTLIQVHAQIVEYENRLRIEYQIFDVLSKKRTTTGYTIQVAVKETTSEMCFVSPDILLQKFENLKVNDDDE